MTAHLSIAQIELIDTYDRGQMSDADFTAAALEAGMSHLQIARAIREAHQADAIAEEDAAEARAMNGQFGAGA